MSQRVLVPEPYNEPYDPNTSVWRLVNLALGLAALLSFVGAASGSSVLVPSRWILAPWFSASSMATVPDWIKFVVRIGVNLWLPASVLMILFALLGFHRKLDAPKSRFVGLRLACSWVAHIVLSAGMFVLSNRYGGSEASGAIGLVVGLVMLPIYFLLGALTFTAAASEIGAMWQFDDPSRARVPVALLSWATLPPAVSVLPLLLAPSNPLALTAQENAEYAQLCSTTGVRLMAKPAGSVRSIAYDWDPARYHYDVFEYRLDPQGRLNYSHVDRASSREVEAKKFLHKLDFRESRQSDYCHAQSEPRMPYAHCPIWYGRPPPNAKYYAIDTFTADVLVYFDVNTADYLNNTVNHGPIKFTIKLTDRRSGEQLGEMSYVVDRVNKRACGANVGTIISPEAFYYDATHR